MSTALDQWIARIKSRDPLVYEDAFHDQWPDDPALIERLVTEMHAAEDAYTRGKFIELLGETGHEGVIDHLVRELGDPRGDVRQWAVKALAAIGGPDVGELLARHRLAHPEDLDPTA